MQSRKDHIFELLCLNCISYHEPLEDLLPKELSPKEREILVLLFEKQLSYEEIAQHSAFTTLTYPC